MTAMDGGMPPSGNADFAGAKICQANIAGIKPTPENGEGDGNTAPDIVGAELGTADLEFSLRSERAGGGSGRIYTVTYTAMDGSDNAAESAATVEVPKS